MRRSQHSDNDLSPTQRRLRRDAWPGRQTEPTPRQPRAERPSQQLYLEHHPAELSSSPPAAIYRYSLVPARFLTDTSPNGVARLDVLLLGDSDLRHSTFTTWNARNMRQARLLDFTVVSACPPVLGTRKKRATGEWRRREGSGTLFALRAAPADSADDPPPLRLRYLSFQPREAAEDVGVGEIAKALLERVADLEDFHAHKFGKIFRFASESSYAAVRCIWQDHAADAPLNCKTFKGEIARIREGYNPFTMVEGEGSAGACADRYADHASDLFHTFWRKGILDPSLPGNLPNPMFVFDKSFALCPYENPMDGFHLAAAYVDVIVPDPRERSSPCLGRIALLRLRSGSGMSGLRRSLTLAERRAGCEWLSTGVGHVVSEGTKRSSPLPAFHVSAPFHPDLSPFIFCDEDYGSPSSPSSAPSVLHSASVDLASFDNELTDRLNDKLGMDTSLFAALVGLVPASDIIGWAPQLQPIVDERWASKMLRVRWRQATLLDPCLFAAIESWPAKGWSKFQIERSQWVEWMANLLSSVCKGEGSYKFAGILSYLATRLELREHSPGASLLLPANCDEIATLASKDPETTPSAADLSRELELWRFAFGQTVDSGLATDPADLARKRTGGDVVQRGSLNGPGLPTVLRVVILVPASALNVFMLPGCRFQVHDPLLDVHLKPDANETFVYETMEIRPARRAHLKAPPTKSLVLVDLPRVILDATPILETVSLVHINQEVLSSWCLPDITSCLPAPEMVHRRTGVDEFNATGKWMVNLRRREPGAENDWLVVNDVRDDDSPEAELLSCPKWFALEDEKSGEV
ncbi:hypothetical protein BDK51DRAFT_49924 [Blyttiomyces helicus]|uniref:Uncharacterized protein n=1 Tax=Blyttiomyces helicus TaxID=388810 RepID=A0A4P9WCK4_9FUNG|nr:hypothetical protein BDK51DRAFT_49924 [Blyttiomyces helicus]|eukprot:RKO88948.1 hypothetical protein BDK51DRAFT_49924 [Blyttiomyces helicus]